MSLINANVAAPVNAAVAANVAVRQLGRLRQRDADRRHHPGQLAGLRHTNWQDEGRPGGRPSCMACIDTSPLMTSDHDPDERLAAADPQEAPTSVVAPVRARKGAPPGVAPEQAPDGTRRRPSSRPRSRRLRRPSARPQPTAASRTRPRLRRRGVVATRPPAPLRLRAGSPAPPRGGHRAHRALRGLRLQGGAVHRPPQRRPDGPDAADALRARGGHRRRGERARARAALQRAHRAAGRARYGAELLDEQLRPLGVVAEADGSSPEIE